MVGGYNVPSTFYNQAFRWRDGVLEVLPAAGVGAEAHATNGSGGAAGHSYLSWELCDRGIAWAADHAPINPGEPVKEVANRAA